MLANARAEQFSVTIRTEATSIGSGVSLEVTQGRKNGIRREVLQTVNLVVASSTMAMSIWTTSRKHDLERSIPPPLFDFGMVA